MPVEATAAPGTILVVDDNPTNIQVLFDVLSEMGYRVRSPKVEKPRYSASNPISQISFCWM